MSSSDLLLHYKSVAPLDMSKLYQMERIPCVPLKVMEILDLPLKKLSSCLYYCFKISHPSMPLPSLPFHIRLQKLLVFLKYDRLTPRWKKKTEPWPMLRARLAHMELSISIDCCRRLHARLPHAPTGHARGHRRACALPRGGPPHHEPFEHLLPALMVVVETSATTLSHAPVLSSTPASVRCGIWRTSSPSSTPWWRRLLAIPALAAGAVPEEASTSRCVLHTRRAHQGPAALRSGVACSVPTAGPALTVAEPEHRRPHAEAVAALRTPRLGARRQER
jgi:hypothetical protein